MSRPPYPPPSALDGGGLGGRSTIDCLIGTARQCVDQRCATSSLHTCPAHTPDPRVPSLALSRSQLKPASRASRHRPLAQAQAASARGSLKPPPRLAQAAAASRSSRRPLLKPPPRLAQAAGVRLAQAAPAPPLAQAAALLAQAAAARTSRRRSLKPPPLR